MMSVLTIINNFLVCCEFFYVKKKFFNITFSIFNFSKRNFYMKNCKTNQKIVNYSSYRHHITLTNKIIDKIQEKKFCDFLAVGGVVILGVKGGQFGGSS